MKRIIEGKSYDTDTAEQIARVDEEDEPSQAWWALYRTMNGAYFEVCAGHDGVVESFRPVGDIEARTLIERNANHLVEKYFGKVPEAGPPQRRFPRTFSRRTILAAVDIRERLTQAAFTRFLLELGPEFPRWVGDESRSLTKRLNGLMALYDQQPDRPVDGDDTIADVIVERAVSLLIPDPDTSWGDPPELPEAELSLRRRLAADGYVVSDRKLQSALPMDIGLPAMQDELRSLLKRHGFETALGHLDQALDGHARAKWATTNSQLRSFLEGLLDEIAVSLDPAMQGLGSEARRAKLAELGFLQTGLNEWSPDGKNFLNGLMKRLHPKGSHPGLSDEQDSTFRLHVVLVTAHLFMTRLNGKR